MSGYTLVEQTQLQPYKEDGLTPHAEVYGCLDFLRELAEAEFPFRRMAELRIVGLEEVLFSARPAEREIAQQIYYRLQRAAPNLEKRLMSVQVVFNGRLQRGESLWVDFRNQRLPIGSIFGAPLSRTDAHGNHFYAVTFHLSSPAA